MALTAAGCVSISVAARGPTSKAEGRSSDPTESSPLNLDLWGEQGEADAVGLRRKSSTTREQIASPVSQSAAPRLRASNAALYAH